MEDDAIDNNIAINWNNIVGQEARSPDDNADLGKIQGLWAIHCYWERNYK